MEAVRIGRRWPMSESKGQRGQRRWWALKRTWLISVPLVVMLGIVGLFAWGGAQPRPEGFAPMESDVTPAASAGSASSVVEELDVPPVGEPPVRITLDAVSMDEWVLFDLVEGRIVEGDFSSEGWDIAFRRTKLLTNSGVTNPDGPGGAYDLGEVPLEEAMAPATFSFAEDHLGGDDADEPENEQAGRWYSYSFITHIVSTKPNTYLIRTGERLDALVQFDSYYCDDEESGCITFRYRLVPAAASRTS
jgi:hypothetical protein